MRQQSGDVSIQTDGKGLYEVTDVLNRFLADIAAGEGVFTIFIQHSSASLTVQENADPDVQLDMRDYFEQLAPEGSDLYRHSAEGADDMPAHIRASLTDVSLTIPVLNGVMRLGIWQGVYVFEHRARSHRRNLALHFMGQ
jgi:secondary thiamine-phosphate synthase enzyme